jgi:hypothetical protein
MQRPLRSQSPKRVGSGPEGPPISRAPAAFGAPGSAVRPSSAEAAAGPESGADGTEGGVEEFFSGLVCISLQVCQNSAPSATNPGQSAEAMGFMNRN